MGSPGPTRSQGDLADLVEMLLDKGVVINADIAVSIGDTELLGVQVRAALASFETAAEYGLEFPEGTDMDRVEAAAAGRSRREVEAGSPEDEETAEGEPEREAVDESEEREAESPSTGRNRVAVRPHVETGSGDEEDEEADDADD